MTIHWWNRYRQAVGKSLSTGQLPLDQSDRFYLWLRQLKSYLRKRIRHYTWEYWKRFSNQYGINRKRFHWKKSSEKDHFWAHFQGYFLFVYRIETSQKQEINRQEQKKAPSFFAWISNSWCGIFLQD